MGGVLWGKPDRADRRRGTGRRWQLPGTFWEYNDVRVNLLALSLLRLWGRLLPQVLKEKMMDPMGDSRSWSWHGCRNSYVPVTGRQVQSVSGGGHGGGDLGTSAHDQARFAYLFLGKGLWLGRRIISEEWIRQALTLCALQPN